MHQKILRLATWLRHGAEAIAAAMLAVMFISFLVTVLFRYVLNWPAGWASELSTVMWVWLVLFGAAFIPRERDEIRFDIFYSNVRPSIRRVMTVFFSIGIVGLFLVSLPAVYDYVTFMKVQRTSYLRIRYDLLYSIYVVFALAIVIRYSWIGIRAALGHDPMATSDADDETQRG
ncbi:TRAP transporter small permease [Halomonas heilongjiangensis]|uniref:TRAP transporter small permease protein n=1 Tax=Halomonas heilongjiangensis TaxID=1387883 RepID=A0A2N7TH27_9GAMM|nr:TRAP transporter small permease subunit [Halomonas heilongjiangensis]PMR67490.1 C4-dicarboxylate ABC transporter permease [Halomonas heilongjiangensis]PXX87066.1 C4-dicarboxylate ABC transporter permease [Halomonas heilongjiangensis]